MKLLLSLYICILYISYLYANETKNKFINDYNKLSFNEDRRLNTATILYPENANEECKKQYESLPSDNFFNSVEVSNEFLEDIFSKSFLIFDEFNQKDGCSIVYLPIYQHEDFIDSPLPQQLAKGVKDIKEFLFENCFKVSMEIHNFLDKDLELFWINNNEYQFVTPINIGTEQFQQGTYIGHRFAILEADTKNIVTEFDIKGYQYVPLGDYQVEEIPDDFSIEETVKLIFDEELERANAVKRTFSELGFKKGKLPRDVWGSMSSYYYLNKYKATVEPWTLDSGLHVNWWEAGSYMVWVPMQIRDIWAERLQFLVEDWVKIPLEATSLYGMRKYTSGSRLLTHVDRTETHAVSLIVNIEQQVSTPWPVQIYDFKHRLHEIEMEEGDVVYYESAKCLHGRMTPLPKNGYYVNLFTHYRPVNDEQWYLKPNDLHAPKPWLEFEEGKEPSTLSPLKQTLYNSNDLFNYWKSITDSINNNIKNEL